MGKNEGRRAAATKAFEGKSFEEVLRRLEEIVESLESGELTVEKSLGLFEEGVGLAREGHRRLDSAEKRITELLEDGSEKPLAAGDVEAGRGGVGDEGDDDDDPDDEKDADS
ncbi:MAG: exodeoxyribonuclease VII small subunit [Deltaproteobacteria bacterium]|nr:exodeoxyribonuclease VII small subunit [Deltaproteobacteria bacterium]